MAKRPGKRKPNGPAVELVHDTVLQQTLQQRRAQPKWGGIWFVVRRNMERALLVHRLLIKIRAERTDAIHCLVLSDIGLVQLQGLMKLEAFRSKQPVQEVCGVLSNDWVFNGQHVVTVGSTFEALTHDLSQFEVVIILSGNETLFEGELAGQIEDIAEQRFVVVITERYRPAMKDLYLIEGPFDARTGDPIITQ